MKKKENDINEQMFYALKVSETSKVPVLFMSAPGMGKSTSVELFSKIEGYSLVVLRGNSTSESEIMGYDVVDAAHPDSKSTVHLWPAWFMEVVNNYNKGIKTLLFVDEITTCPEHVQSALLHLIFERKVGAEKIPDDTLIVAAGNYSQSLGSGFGLIPPLMNRFCIYNIVPTIDDLCSFLTHYEGAAVNKMKNFEQEKIKQLKKLMASKKVVDDTLKNRIAESIELGIRETTNMLGTKENVLDPKVTDLQDIYSSTDRDDILRGFVSCRTLTYLVNVTIAVYLNYGSKGIQKNLNYQNLVEGLCGIGLTRAKNGEIVSNKIASSFIKSMETVATDLDKMENNKLKEYSEYIREVVTNYNDASINSLTNKLSEIMSDRDINGIERPLNPDDITSIMNLCDTKLGEVASLLQSQSSMESITPSEVSGYICKWNATVQLLLKLQTLLNLKTLNYSEPLKASLLKLMEEKNRSWYKIKVGIRIVKKNNPGAIIPELTNLVG